MSTQYQDFAAYSLDNDGTFNEGKSQGQDHYDGNLRVEISGNPIEEQETAKCHYGGEDGRENGG